MKIFVDVTTLIELNRLAGVLQMIFTKIKINYNNE